MKLSIMISVAPLLLTVGSACRVSDASLSTREPSPIILDFEVAIKDLEEGKDRQTVRAAVQTLKDAKSRAFPALIKHLSDKTNASFEYFGGRDVQCGPEATPCTPWRPTIGHACFAIIQSQIEGNWPKGYQSYYTLTPENVGEWWESRRTMSLKDLQLETAKSSLARATLKRDVDAVRFLQEHLKDVQAGRCCQE
jgi:hypothetical protein